MDGQFIGIDWGTTNRRIFAIDSEGIVTRTEREGCGVLSVEPEAFASEVYAIRSVYGDLPILMAGMIGSTRGWHCTPYVATPADLAALAKNVQWIEPGHTGILPGVEQRSGNRGDVMRGEEVQFLGAASAGLVPTDALLCQPGTHCKWAWMKSGRIDRFATSMTGEMFALLKDCSLLSAQLLDEVVDGPAFAEGVCDAAGDDLLGTLFSVRASWLLGLRSREDGASYASGLLIGSDVRARLRGGKEAVYILADPTLGGLYGTAIKQLGAVPHLVDSHAAFVAGLTRIWNML